MNHVVRREDSELPQHNIFHTGVKSDEFRFSLIRADENSHSNATIDATIKT